LKTDSHIQIIEGVYVSESAHVTFSEFETAYLSVRNKENRVLSIDEIKKLPNAFNTNPNYKEWKLRKNNTRRLVNYIQKKPGNLNILDIGCGNGFLTNLVAGNKHHAIGIDVNLFELKQAAQAFPKKNISWFYADILTEDLPFKNIDIIIFAASFQYFKDAQQILKICKSYLAKHGEIHILDSPFYNLEDIVSAKENSNQYFKKLNANEMMSFYNHHSFKIFNNFEFEVKYQPNTFLNKFFKFSYSPFPWIKIL